MLYDLFLAVDHFCINLFSDLALCIKAAMDQSKANFYRVSRLLVDKGCDPLRAALHATQYI